MYNLLTFSLNGGIFGLHSFCVSFLPLGGQSAAAAIGMDERMYVVHTYIILFLFRYFFVIFAAFISFSRSFYPFYSVSQSVCSRLVFHLNIFKMMAEK